MDDCSLVLSNDESTQAKVDETLAHLNAYLDDNTNFVYKVVTLEEKVAPKVETSNELLVQTPVVQEQPQVVAPTVETKNVEAAKWKLQSNKRLQVRQLIISLRHT